MSTSDESPLPILAGIETEYGLLVDGHGAEDQIDDAIAFVRSYPDPCFVGWDYHYESPRADLRGFVLNRLTADPEDLKFEKGRQRAPDHEVRSDRVLPNGARFYNDHGHPEYSTPECWSIKHLAAHDAAGEVAMLRTADAFHESTDLKARVYKNNTDYHGASYGTHENYLVPRKVGFEALYKAVTPMLIARQLLVGAGKVGAETGNACAYQLSQRADFFTEAFNAETLYRRPVFNTRDEPHAKPQDWIRMHVIAGDANMICSATARKVGLVKIAAALAVSGEPPLWKLADPVEAFKVVSRDETFRFAVQLEGRSWTTAYEILESYFAAAEQTLDLDADMKWTIDSSRKLLGELTSNFAEFKKHVDWAAKRSILETYMDDEGIDWRDPSLKSFDLEYHNVDPGEGLHAALEQMGEVEPSPSLDELSSLLEGQTEQNRALARGLSVSRFGKSLRAACWRSVSFETEDGPVEVELLPNARYPAQLAEAVDVGSFIECLRGVM